MGGLTKDGQRSLTDYYKESTQEKVVRVLAIILIILCPIALLLCFRVVKQYKRAVVLRFGRVRGDSPAGPGVIWVVPCTDAVIQIDLRTQTINLPPQLILTKDYVTVKVGAVVHLRVYKPVHCLLNVQSHKLATELLAVSILRNIVCGQTLTELLMAREWTGRQIKTDVGKATAEWGVKIEQVEIKDIILPVELQKAMAVEAEGRRTAKSKIIESEGEVKTAEHLRDASAVMARNPHIMQVLLYKNNRDWMTKYIRIMASMGSETNSDIYQMNDHTRPRYHSTGTDKIIESFLMLLSLIIVVVFFPFSLACVFVIVRQFEEVVILRNGKLHGRQSFGPGLVFYLPCIDTIKYIDRRIMCHMVPPEECLTKDSLTLTVQAVIYYKVIDPMWAIMNVADFNLSTKSLAATALRNTIGKHYLKELLVNRAEISSQVSDAMKRMTDKWGILVNRIEMNNVSVPLSFKKSMAAEAVASRLANAKIAVAQAEIEASKILEKAAEMLMENPMGMQLRYLESLQTIASEKTHTVVFPYSKNMAQQLFLKT